MKILYKILSFLVTIAISCNSDDNDNITSNPIGTNKNISAPIDLEVQDTSKYRFKGNKKVKNKFTVFICTANLFMHLGYPSRGGRVNKNDLSDEFIKLLLSKANPKENDLIIFGFQELFETDTYFHEQLINRGAKLAKSRTEQGFTNTIAVFSNFKNGYVTKTESVEFPGKKYRTGRSACLVDMADINLSVVNTHLFGGKYDDKEWESHRGDREEMLSIMISNGNPIGKKPNIVLGDFNCDTNISPMAENYWKNTILKNHTTDKTLTYNNVKDFLAAAHDYLKGKGYSSLLDRSLIATTTPFDTVPDWIYFSQGQLKSHKIVQQGVYKARDSNLSDHDFPWVRIEVEV